MATNLCFLVLNLERIYCLTFKYLIYFYCFLLLLTLVFSRPLTKNSPLFSFFNWPVSSHPLTKNSVLFSLFIDLSLLSSLDKEKCTSLDKEQCTIFSFYWLQSPFVPWQRRQRTVHCFLFLLTSVSSRPLTKNSALFSLLWISVSSRPLTKKSALFSLSFDSSFLLSFDKEQGKGVWSFETFL